MKKFLFTLTAAVLLLACNRHDRPGFAIVIDPESYSQARTEIDRYQQVVESRGLYPFLVIDRWGVPDSIRACLMALHHDRKHPIEGCVFIGDIPVPMIRDAQHMASAFKMDQNAFPRIESSIPSDRYYDSFDLEFDYQGQDSVRWFYYSLRADCPQQLHPTIYSARITPRDNERGGKYEKLRRYMQRVNQADERQNRMDRVLLFGGHGNVSGSFRARTDAIYEFYEQFPWMRDRQQSVQYLDYARDKFVKRRLTDELQRPDLDYALLQHHGDITIQYLSGTSERYAVLKTSEFPDFHPQSIVVNLDACYNGAFHVDDNIQEAYLFGEGNGTLLVLANSVNAIQDKWANRNSGLLGLGARAGYLMKYDAFIEYHLFGDPTYGFTPSADCGFDVNDAILHASDRFWLKQLDNEYPAIQMLAMTRLADSERDYSHQIYDRYCSSGNGIVRVAAMMQLARYNNDCFKACVKEALNDEQEMAQRFAVLYAGQSGDPSFVPELAALRCQNNLSERVDFDLDNIFRSYDSASVYRAIDSTFALCTFYANPDSVLEHLHGTLKYSAGYMPFDVREALNSENASQRAKMLSVQTIRNNPPHYALSYILDYLAQPLAEDSVVQKAAWESLGWFNLSYRGNEIREAAQKVFENDAFPASVRNEALKTYHRIIQ